MTQKLPTAPLVSWFLANMLPLFIIYIPKIMIMKHTSKLLINNEYRIFIDFIGYRPIFCYFLFAFLLFSKVTKLHLYVHHPICFKPAPLHCILVHSRKSCTCLPIIFHLLIKWCYANLPCLIIPYSLMHYPYPAISCDILLPTISFQNIHL